MKKIFAAVALVTTMFVPVAAQASGTLDIGKEKYEVVDKGDGKYEIHYYCEVTNNGDEPVTASKPVLDITDADGNIFQTYTSASMSPKYLQPGDTGYMVGGTTVKEVEDIAQVSNYNFEVSVGAAPKEYYRLKVEPRLLCKETDEQMKTMIYFDVMNENEETQDWLQISMGIYDQNDDLMFAKFFMCPDVALIPNMPVTFYQTMESAVEKRWKEDNQVPTTVRVQGYSKSVLTEP